jgi:dCTP deaminase
MTIENYIGTLNDVAIDELCTKGILIAANYKAENVSQACYELSAGNIYYDITENFKRIDITEQKFDYILIKPKQSVVIITKEELNIPGNVIGRILTKGKLFSIGLLPVNTYADPGFQGNPGIILHNNSINYLKIKEDELIAKIEFSALQHPVKKRYNGQHGYKTKIWPIPVEYSLTNEDIRNDTRIGTAENEIEQIYGSRYSSVIKRLLGVEKKLLLAAILYFFFSILLITSLIYMDKTDWITNLLAVIFGLVSNILSFFFIYKIEKSKWFNGK